MSEKDAVFKKMEHKMANIVQHHKFRIRSFYLQIAHYNCVTSQYQQLVELFLNFSVLFGEKPVTKLIKKEVFMVSYINPSVFKCRVILINYIYINSHFTD